MEVVTIAVVEEYLRSKQVFTVEAVERAALDQAPKKTRPKAVRLSIRRVLAERTVEGRLQMIPHPRTEAYVAADGADVVSEITDATRVRELLQNSLGKRDSFTIQDVELAFNRARVQASRLWLDNLDERVSRAILHQMLALGWATFDPKGKDERYLLTP